MAVNAGSDLDTQRRRVLKYGLTVGGMTGGAIVGPGGVTATSDEPDPSDWPVVYAEDFESGTLDGYRTESGNGRHQRTFDLTDSPARGDWAVGHATSSQYLLPEDDLSLEPPLWLSLDIYIDGMAGVDVYLQHDVETGLAYRIKFRHNFNGDVFEVEKIEDPLGPDGGQQVQSARTTDGGFAIGRWETLEIRWERDGRITATVQSSGVSRSIQDDELAGHPFSIGGYHYSGRAMFDDLEIRSPGGNRALVLGAVGSVAVLGVLLWRYVGRE